ncbi:MAG: YggT family protein [Candidatus Peregrinibacteria bacterium]|nr:YggT family protein [Candidatus Peregrinibacteria bacterium]
MEFLIYFIDTFFQLLSVAIIARILMSWFRANPTSGFYQFVISVTDPVMNLAKKVTPRAGMLDFSPIIALIAIDIINAVLIRILLSI